MGISYGGISQLFTAQTNPPSLAAISPLSLIDAVADHALPRRHPEHGLRRRLGQGARARGAGRPVPRTRPGVGLQADPGGRPDLQGQPGPARPRRADADQEGPRQRHTTGRRSPTRSRRSRSSTRSRCPTFVACQWTDEQTGGHCPTLASRFTGTDKKWFTFTNGTHVDSLAPGDLQPLVRLPAALRRRAGADRRTRRAIRAAAPLIYQEAMGIEGVTLPPDPIQEEPTYDGALAAFEALDPVRILFDNGAGGEPGQPVPGLRAVVPELPDPGHDRALVVLRERRRAAATSRRHAPGPTRSQWNARQRPLTNFTGNTAAGEAACGPRRPPTSGRRTPTGSAVSYLTAAARREHDGDRRRRRAGVGPLVEADRRPPGDDHRGPARRQGDLRAERLAARQHAQARRGEEHAARARPEPARARHRADAARSASSRSTIPLYYQGHAYRAGSRIRVTISRPNGDQPIWAFAETRPKAARERRDRVLEASGRRA